MNSSEILGKHNLKGTSCRLGILDIMISSQHALSETEIRDNLEGNYDRSTFYRSFKTLEDCNIIHKIVVDNLCVKYELDNSVSQRKKHAHFYCKKCDTLQCLDSVEISFPKLPENYEVFELELIVKGECKECIKGGERTDHEN